MQIFLGKKHHFVVFTFKPGNPFCQTVSVDGTEGHTTGPFSRFHFEKNEPVCVSSCSYSEIHVLFRVFLIILRVKKFGFLAN